jgi:hypothetical protein
MFNRSITIQVTPSAQPPAFDRRPGLRFTNTDFIRGFPSGVGQAYAGNLAGVPYTDEEPVQSLKELFEGADESEQSAQALSLSLGSLIGMLTARCSTMQRCCLW